MEAYSEEFNSTIKTLFSLFRKLPSKMLQKAHIERLHKKMLRSMHTHQEYAITILGPYVWSAREEIERSDAEYFLKREYGAEIMALSRIHKFDYEDALKAISYMKEAYRNSGDDVHREIMCHFKYLLKTYASYSMTCKHMPVKSSQLRI